MTQGLIRIRGARQHNPEIDIRIDASDASLDLDVAGR